MTVADPKNPDALPQEDRDALIAALKHLKEQNVAPIIPLDVDLDGDGKVDGWGLDASDNLIFVSGTAIEETGYHSDGDDMRGPVDPTSEGTNVVPEAGE